MDQEHEHNLSSGNGGTGAAANGADWAALTNGERDVAEERALMEMVEHCPAGPAWEDIRESVIEKAEELAWRRGLMFRPRPRRRLLALAAVAAVMAVAIFSVLMLTPKPGDSGTPRHGNVKFELVSAWHQDAGMSYQSAPHR